MWMGNKEIKSDYFVGCFFWSFINNCNTQPLPFIIDHSPYILNEELYEHLSNILSSELENQIPSHNLYNVLYHCFDSINGRK